MRRPDPMLVAGIGLATFVLLLSFIGPLLWPVDPFALGPHSVLSRPSLAHPAGTDDLGRDSLARLISGGATTLTVAIPSAIIAFLAACFYGFAAALGPAWLDRLLMRLLDAILALPSLVVLIFFAALTRLDAAHLAALLGLVSAPSLARLIRNEALAQRERDFILAARQLGASPFYIARVHLLRVMAPILVVNATFLVGDTILALSALSFLGLGVQPPHTSWGGLLESGLTVAPLGAWWLIVPPGGMIFLAMLAASLTGRGLLARAGDRL
ncbi:peptide/nickel transport system permease protein [Endobacter medicaginis]|uniref:ABC transporter permease n=1 Tax=Endobacter medicaginis TaxID=1181271 RepID=A0A850NPG9_9PROT|nr:ABC transporter permease [Endobacter medicaginis]MBB3174622.1 peptide/nickel transport system permease protein [Endobacter medicaginis]MCX5474686.1 ABC transporter permease [Endobacter medicaginis]NVN29756.1 ABC transporter permease [Endobacter medicaginis]